MTTSSVFLRRVVLQNYKNIARCSVKLHPLNFLIGQNGAGKSNFLDALEFTSESLRSTVDKALHDRGGVNEVRRRSTGHPTHFGIRLDWTLPSGDYGSYEFRIGAKPQGAFEIQHEKCIAHPAGPLKLEEKRAFYEIHSGKLQDSSITMPPAIPKDQLFLHAMSGQPEFRPLYVALLNMGFYSFNPDVIRDHQSPEFGRILASDGRNLASVLKRMKNEPGMADLIKKLGRIVPGITGVSDKAVGKKETLAFQQLVAGSKNSWGFEAENMSDGTLRTLGVLVALFQPPVSDGQEVRLVGIEEPETALHPGAAAVLRSALFEASARTQVIVTSHSPDLLDDKMVTHESLISVTSQNGETKIGRVDEVSRDAIKDHLFTAGELLRLNRIGVDETTGDDTAQSELNIFEPTS